MTVAGDHHLESSGFGFQIELSEIVEDVDRDASDFENFRLGELARPRIFVDVAANSSDRRDGRERLQDSRIADVSGMNDVLGTSQGFYCFEAKQAVRVGDDAD